MRNGVVVEAVVDVDVAQDYQDVDRQYLEEVEGSHLETRLGEIED